MRRLSLLYLPVVLGAAAPPQLVAASGQWAALRQGRTCEAATLGLRKPTATRRQARASLSFDSFPGGRAGQFAVRLGSEARPGSSVMLHSGDSSFLLIGRGAMAWSRDAAQDQAIISAIRHGGAMRVEGHAPGGMRIVERFDLAGGATAIDAAAACAAGLAKR
jgi:hypothetical protein